MSIYLKQSDSVDLLTSQSDVLGKTVTLHYVSTNLLSGSVEVPERYNGGVAFCSVLNIPGTPYSAIQLVYTSPISNNLIQIYAKGAGFVSGHMLQVGVLAVH